MKLNLWKWVWLLLLCGLPAMVHAQYTVTTNADNTLTIAGYSGSGGAVTIPSAINGMPVTGIGDHAFNEIGSLTSVTIGTNITSIGQGPFSDCIYLNAITVAPGNSAYMSVAGILFNSDQTALIQYPPHKSGTSYNIPNSVISIGNNAFSESDYLTSITMGPNVTSIGGAAFFLTMLNTVTIPSGVTNIGDYAFEDDAFLTNGIYFKGNAPTCGTYTFKTHSGGHTIAYYYPGTSGWDPIFNEFYNIPSVMLNAPSQAGSLQVSIVPDEAVAAGASWQVDGGVPQPSGSTVWGLTVANHTVSFAAAPGWVPASNQVVSVNANSTATVDGTYLVEPPLEMTTYVLPNGTNTLPYVQQLFAIYGQPPYRWSLISNSLPSALILATNGFISGTPMTNGTFNFTVMVTDTLSATATQSLSLIINAANIARLTVSTSGIGLLNTNFDGALLQIGQTYTLTATAGPGFVFSDWTGGTSLPLIVLTNRPTLRFVMASNLMLQANFVDTNKPTIGITNVPAGLNVSNPAFVVRGTASDNWQVTNVYCSLNSGAWTNAASTNNWTNWTAAVTLIPGTNSFAAYAVDPAGDVSPTTSARLFLVVTNQLQIHAVGLGTISPNYSNAWLNLGQNYSITSSPASGFLATNWVISTNWIGGVATNAKVVHFMMSSNLTLQVNFMDTSRPTNTITAPTKGQHMTNALATVVGKASDNWKVAGVWYQLNNGTWNAIGTTNTWTNWMSTLQLIAGTNTIKSYAMDLAGNLSTTSSVSVISSNTFKLQLAFTNLVPLKTNGFVFNLELSSGLNGHIQVSTNLINWATLTNFVGTNSSLTFRDPAATNSSHRYYRAVIP